MTDFLLELRSEEIPARMQAKARDDLAKLFSAELIKAGIEADALVTYATPRRLALIARGLPLATQAVSEEIKGPRTSAPPQALEGFLRKTGLAREQLEDCDGVWFAVIDKPGRATAEVLAEAITAVIRAFPWPKSMRWGDASVSTESLRWVRPLQGIVALLGEEVVPCEVAGVASGAATVGHRFHHPGAITIGSAADYVEKLRACHVIVDPAERAAIIRDGAAKLAGEAGLVLVEDESLVAENAGLTEWPVPLLGSFDARLLDAPREILELTLKVNQKYFSVRCETGETAPGFVCVANIAARDGGDKIVAGNRKVAEARLSDAIFFWEQDKKVPLAEQAKKLDRIVFHEKLGTVADKATRVGKLARWLVEEGIVGNSGAPAQAELAELAEQAGLLCKADLVTQTVGEFPEVQGIIGYELAKAQGLDTRVAEAIRDHYKPVGQGDEVPTAPVSVAVALADKLDTLVAFFFADMPPTGSKDPFALRRAALGVLELLTRNGLRLNLWEGITRGLRGMTDLRISPESSDEALVEHKAAMESVFTSLPTFFADRLKVQQREAGVRHDLIDAVFALGGEDDLVRLLARVHALQAFVGTEDGANLLAGYKRAANILKKEGYVAPAQAGAHGSVDEMPAPVDGEMGPRLRGGDGGKHVREGAAIRSRLRGGDGGEPASGTADGGGEAAEPYAREPAEAELIAALDAAEPEAAAAIAREDFEAAMAALATLRGPIDRFFDTVTVNDADAAKRAARLALLARMRDAVHRVADFSKIEG
ncbi:glycine--tRNA ligase subunit beta [Sphingosinithalassobacter sp. LHW66-3]|uniref:glycine--tRNA ligase subunit beta n=1 Tax=Sphingosinithalassobacter sp. LHW66-3 TaxID=3424718 RepID=UPI003D6C3750